jgi:hydroxymethylpyrimidine pyrophosphatase-like HAD family hydrolase
VDTVRLVATDLDGTLVRSDGTISARTRATLRRVEARGIPVVLAAADEVTTSNDEEGVARALERLVLAG